MRRSWLTVPFLIFGLAVAIASPAVATSPVTTSPAPSGSDGSAYVYWSLWTDSAGTWTPATKGAGSLYPQDGGAEGWRYGTGSSATLSQPPIDKPNFQQVCGSTPAKSGMRRVAIYLDFGTTNIAPNGETPPTNSATCAQVAPSTNDQQALASVTSVRTGTSGLVCGLSNYPSSGCGQSLPLSQVSQTETTSNTGTQSSSATTSSLPSWAPFLLGAVVIIGLVGAAIGINRRRSEANSQQDPSK